MTPQPIPLLDGRRAVAGDIVECLTIDFDFRTTAVEVRRGERYTVDDRREKGSSIFTTRGEVELLDVHISLREYPTTFFDAQNFKIIPPDTKAETRMAIESVKERAN